MKNPKNVPPIAAPLFCEVYKFSMDLDGKLDPQLMFNALAAAGAESLFKPVFYRITALVEVIAAIPVKVAFNPLWVPSAATCRLAFRTLKFKPKDLVAEMVKYEPVKPEPVKEIASES